VREVVGVDLIVSKLHEMRESCVNSISRGAVQNMEDYRRLVGVIQGVEFAISVVRDVEERLEEGEENVGH
jgi:hypothetical protein